MKKLIFVLAAGLVSGPAVLSSFAQGTGTTPYVAPEPVNPAAARLQAQVSNLQAQVSELTGRIESLEFETAQAKRQAGDASEASDALMQQMRAQRQEIENMKRVINRQTAMLNALMGNPSAGAQAGLQSQTFGNSEAFGDNGQRALDSSDFGNTNSFDGNFGDSFSQETSTEDNAFAASERTGFGSDNLAGGGTRDFTQGLSQGAGNMGNLASSRLPSEPGALFREGRSRLERFDYPGAEVAFRGFVETFGEDPQAGEAHYWLGEVLYQQQDYTESAQIFTEMLRNYGDDERAPDAVVKLARSIRMVGDTTRACQFLSTLPRRYPNASPVVRNLAALESQRSGC